MRNHHCMEIIYIYLTFHKIFSSAYSCSKSQVTCRLFSIVMWTIHLLEVNKSKDSWRNKSIQFFSPLAIKALHLAWWTLWDETCSSDTTHVMTIPNACHPVYNREICIQAHKEENFKTVCQQKLTAFAKLSKKMELLSDMASVVIHWYSRCSCKR